MSITTGFLVIIALVGVCSLVSISEIVFAAARDTRMRSLAEAGDKRAVRFLHLRANTGEVITALQITLNAFGILAGIIGESFLGPVMAGWFEQAGMRLELAQPVGSVVSFCSLTALFVMFSDLIPKRLAMLMPERMALKVVWWLELILFGLRPFVWVFNGLANRILALAGVKAGDDVNDVTADELRMLLAGGQESGVLMAGEHRLMENVMALQQRGVTSIMTVRDEIVYLDINDGLDVQQEKVRSDAFAHYPLCDGGIDNVVGCVRAEDVLAATIKNRQEPIDFNKYKRDLLAVPDTLNVWEVLSEFQAQNTGAAIVISEYAHVVGIVTYKDLMGALMQGVVNPFEEPAILQRDETSWLVDGMTSLVDVTEALQIKYDPYAFEGDYETIGGLIVHRLRRAARKGDKMEAFGYVFEVVDADRMRLNQLLVTKKIEKKEA